MKVVIFCGGQGLRMREASEVVPKPMIPIGNRPVLWHVMKYYAHFGFTDFVLCLGYKAEAIKQFFLTYNEAMANDFVLVGRRRGGPPAEDRHPRLEHHVRRHRACTRRSASGCAPSAHLLRDDEMFLANYGDTLTDADLPAMIERAKDERRDGELPRRAPELQLPRRLDGRRRPRRRRCSDVTRSDIWINGGYFVLRREFLDQLRPGEDLVEEPFQRLLAARQGAGAAPRGLLGADGHAEGQAVAREPARGRQGPLAALGPGPTAPRVAASRRRSG